MDVQTTFIITKFISSIVFAAGGILALRYGYQLYLKKIGNLADASTFKIMNLEITPRSIGAVMMVTSVAWGWLSYSSMPKTFVMNPMNGSVEIACLAADFGLIMAELSQENGGRAPASTNHPQETFALKITDKPDVAKWLQNHPEELTRISREMLKRYSFSEVASKGYSLENSTITTNPNGKVQVSTDAVGQEGKQIKIDMDFVERNKQLVLEVTPQPVPEVPVEIDTPVGE